jgi:hypothetical protein
MAMAPAGADDRAAPLPSIPSTRGAVKKPVLIFAKLYQYSQLYIMRGYNAAMLNLYDLEQRGNATDVII